MPHLDICVSTFLTKIMTKSSSPPSVCADCLKDVTASSIAAHLSQRRRLVWEHVGQWWIVHPFLSMHACMLFFNSRLCMSRLWLLLSSCIEGILIMCTGCGPPKSFNLFFHNPCVPSENFKWIYMFQMTFHTTISFPVLSLFHKKNLCHFRFSKIMVILLPNRW